MYTFLCYVYINLYKILYFNFAFLYIWTPWNIIQYFNKYIKLLIVFIMSHFFKILTYLIVINLSVENFNIHSNIKKNTLFGMLLARHIHQFHTLYGSISSDYSENHIVIFQFICIICTFCCTSCHGLRFVILLRPTCSSINHSFVILFIIERDHFFSSFVRSSTHTKKCKHIYT